MSGTGYAVENFGCRASAADGDRIAAELELHGTPAAARGWRDADVVVVNTCAVTEEAERSARALIRRVVRANPEARIVVTGCYAQRAPAELASLAGVAAVVGNSHKFEVTGVVRDLQARAASGTSPAAARPKDGSLSSDPDGAESTDPVVEPSDGLPADAATGSAALPGAERSTAGRRSGWNPAGFVPLRALAPAPVLHAPFPRMGLLGASRVVQGTHPTGSAVPARAGDLPAEPSLGPAMMLAGRTRPVLKVQDGCGNACSFCVIPETRGASRSVALGEVLATARGYIAAGVQELVLSGINLGRWGRDLRPARTLVELVRALMEETELGRLRVSSVEPMDWTRELISLLERYGAGMHPRLAPHAHLPLQSGSDAVLRAMHRRYRPWHYASKLAELQAALPDAALGADVMVGFPGETEALFAESLAFVEAQPLTYLHLFPFSARPGTRAAAMPPVEGNLVRERMRRMAELGERKRRGFQTRAQGRVLSAVTLGDGTALTANFLTVRLADGSTRNRMVRLRIAPAGEPGASIEGWELGPEAPDDLSEVLPLRRTAQAYLQTVAKPARTRFLEPSGMIAAGSLTS